LIGIAEDLIIYMYGRSIQEYKQKSRKRTAAYAKIQMLFCRWGLSESVRIPDLCIFLLRF
jgi:hypothetical protein